MYVLRLVQLWLAAFLGQGVVCWLALRLAATQNSCWRLLSASASVVGLLIHS